MRLSFYASQPHYWRHLRPIVAVLRARGVDVDVWSSNYQPWGPAATDVARRHVAPIVVVASYQDAQKWRDRACVYVEHGAGQTYRTDDLEEPERLKLGFAGGGGLEHVALFLCPSERVADRWRDAYPRAEVAVVGAPALDRYYSGGVLDGFLDHPRGSVRVIAVTCHWRFDVIPEGKPALPLYLEALADLHFGELGLFAVGHGHPRIQTEARRWWDTIGIPFEPDPDRILADADLLVADNTSLLPEAAAAGIPLLWLNAPYYRRDVEHGGRFWDWPRGQVQCDRPEDLADKIRLALSDPPEVRAAREAMLERIYS